MIGAVSLDCTNFSVHFVFRQCGDRLDGRNTRGIFANPFIGILTGSPDGLITHEKIMLSVICSIDGKFSESNFLTFIKTAMKTVKSMVCVPNCPIFSQSTLFNCWLSDTCGSNIYSF